MRVPLSRATSLFPRPAAERPPSFRALSAGGGEKSRSLFASLADYFTLGDADALQTK